MLRSTNSIIQVCIKLTIIISSYVAPKLYTSALAAMFYIFITQTTPTH